MKLILQFIFTLLLVASPSQAEDLKLKASDVREKLENSTVQEHANILHKWGNIHSEINPQWAEAIHGLAEGIAADRAKLQGNAVQAVEEYFTSSSASLIQPYLKGVAPTIEFSPLDYNALSAAAILLKDIKKNNGNSGQPSNLANRQFCMPPIFWKCAKTEQKNK